MTVRLRSPPVRVGWRSGAVEPAVAGAGAAGTQGEEVRTSGPGRKKGFVKMMYRMHPRQVAALRAEAFRRAEKLTVGRPDASEVLREIVDAWLEKRRG